MLHGAASSAHAVQCDGQPRKRREIGWVANRPEANLGLWRTRQRFSTWINSCHSLCQVIPLATALCSRGSTTPMAYDQGWTQNFLKPSECRLQRFSWWGCFRWWATRTSFFPRWWIYAAKTLSEWSRPIENNKTKDTGKDSPETKWHQHLVSSTICCNIVSLITLRGDVAGWNRLCVGKTVWRSIWTLVCNWF